MLHLSLITLTLQYKKSARHTALHQDPLRAGRIIIAIRRAVVG